VTANTRKGNPPGLPSVDPHRQGRLRPPPA
jgi:hypothetical protein